MGIGNRQTLVLIRNIVNTLWVLQWLIILAIIVYVSFLLLNVDFFNLDILKGFKIHFSKIDFLKPILIDGKEHLLKLTNGEGRLHIENYDQKFIYMRILAAFIDSFLYLLILFFIRKIFKNLTANQFFIPENGVLIRKIGFTIITLAILPEVIHYFTDAMVAKSIHIDGVILKNEFDLDLQTILLGVLIFVISIVFLRGIELKKDQELTI
jgi:hypothetical protein